MNTRTLGVILIVGFLVWRSGQLQDPPGPGPGPGPTPGPGGVPAADMQAAVAPIKALGATHHEVAEKMAPLYHDLAEVLVRDSTIVGTTGQIRRAISRAESLFAQRSGLAGGLPGFSAALNALLATQLGLEDVSLDAAKRQKAVDVLLAVAWALEG